GRDFVAYSPALDISTVGKSIQDAQKKFEALSGLFIDEIVKAGTFEEVLTELGWKKGQKQFTPPQVVANKSIEIKIPAFV
ncbi:MAG: hypothetical protein Q8Q36_01955, partial [bacterium]|nr:hypothetical protein [bacterium]